MVRGKGKGTGKHNNAPNTSQTETTVSGNIEMNVKETVVESKDMEENDSKGLVNEENAIAVMKSGDIVEEEEENNLKTAMEEEDEEEHEENIMELEGDKTNERDTLEGEEGEEENTAEEEEEEEEEENEKQAMEQENNEVKVAANEEQAMDQDNNEVKVAANEEQAVEQENNEVKVAANSDEKVKRARGSRGRRSRKGHRTVVETVAAELEDKPGSSRKKKVSKRAESMGLVFMCSSKTKKDCFTYKVLGLPASKRDVVQKVYKGMRLFLFDVDLRLMYGIYKAAGPGGYNIEPKAFNSAFPSQVRFTVLEDCLPLAEEKFKTVIKDNYYSRTKFHCELTEEKVKKLCKLFVAAGRSSKSKKLGRNRRAETRTYANRDRMRRHSPDGKRFSLLGADRRDRRYSDHPDVYERETFLSRAAPLPRLQPVHAPPAPLYDLYGRTLEMDVYRHDPRVERLDHPFLVSDTRRQDEYGRPDPYIVYGDPPTYREPLYSAGLGLRPEHSSCAGLPADYRQSERHHPAAAPSGYHPYRY